MSLSATCGNARIFLRWQEPVSSYAAPRVWRRSRSGTRICISPVISSVTIFTLEDQKDYVCHPANFRELDYGFDFYAPQTFTDQQGRRILIGWAGMSEEADYGNDPIIKEGWQHSLTVPRLLSFSDGILRQYPVPELETAAQPEAFSGQ